MPGRKPPRVVLALAAALALAGAGLAVFLAQSSQEPSYQGRGATSWFPRWHLEFRWSEVTQQQDCRTLQDAGPEAMPMLAAASQVRDTAFTDAYRNARQSLPSYLTHYTLPRRRDPGAIEFAVTRVLERQVTRREPLAAFLRHWDRFPESIQHSSLAWFRTTPRFPDLLEPHLLTLLESTHPAIAQASALALVHYPSMTSGIAPRVLHGLARVPPSDLAPENAAQAAELTLRLTQLGPDAREAVPWLERWLSSRHERLRALAAITLPAVAPDRFPLRPTLEAARASTNRFSLAHALDLARVRFTADRLPWVELVPLVARELRELRSPPPQVSPQQDQAIGMDQGEGPVTALVYLQFLGELGPGAAPAVPSIIPWLDVFIYGQVAAQSLARIGPVAPDSIPDLTRHLGRLETAAEMVYLLGAYGNRAQSAIPALEALAEGASELTDTQPSRLVAATASIDGVERHIRVEARARPSDVSIPEHLITAARTGAPMPPLELPTPGNSARPIRYPKDPVGLDTFAREAIEKIRVGAR